MRSRNLKPGFFKNEDLCDCEPLARILFAGLWEMADRDGRLEDRPRLIKVEILPFDECDIEKLLDQLSDREFIRRYTADGGRFIDIPKFARHQNPHRDEKSRGFPAFPEKSYTSTVQTQCDNSSSTVPAQCQNSSSPADSLLLIPDSLIPDSLSPSPTAKKPAAAKRPRGYPAEFTEWWNAYPRRDGKSNAAIAWTKAVNRIMSDRGLCRPEAIEMLLKSAAHFANTPAGRAGKFVPMPATWLNGSRWEDDTNTWSLETQSINGQQDHNSGSGNGPSRKRDF